MTDSICAKCGAPVPAGRSCLETSTTCSPFTSASGSILHFYLVAAYNLRPDGVTLTAGALAGQRRNVADALDGKASVRVALYAISLL